MRCSAYWLTAVVLLLVAGCAAPMFSGAGARGNPDSDAQRPGEATVSDTTGTAGTARVADRKGAEFRTAPRNASTAEKRTGELLESAALSRRAGRLDVARSAYEQVLRLDPQNRTAHFQLACIADDEARFADAERHYAILMRQAPHDPDLLASLGWSYLLQGKYDASERTLRDALQYAPAHQTALYNLGWLYGTRGDYDQALAIFRSAGSEADAQNALAELQRRARQAPNAVVSAVAAAPRDTTSPPAIGGGGAVARSGAAGGASVVPASYSSAEVSPTANTMAGRQPATMSASSTGRGMTAPAPWNDARTAGSRNPLPAGQIPARNDATFPEIDPYAGLPPTQANHPRQAEPLTYDVSADRTAAAGIRSESVEPVSSIPVTRQGGPVITPAVPGRGTANSRLANISRNNLPQPRLPGRKSMAAGDGAEIASLAGAAPRPAGGASQEARLTAARLGLSAGPGGPFIPVGDWIDLPPAPASATLGSTTELGAEGAGRPSAVAGGNSAGQTPATLQQSPTNQTAGYGSGPLSAPPAAGLAPWPGRAPVPTAVPTDVTPGPQTPGL